MVTIKTFSNSLEAGFAKSQLSDAGIEAFLPDEASSILGYQNAIGQVRLQVPEKDAERALRILEENEGFEPLPDDAEVPPADPADAPALPSSELTRGFIRAFGLGGMFALVFVALLSMVATSSGGSVWITPGGLLIVFGLGGLVGLAFKLVQNLGRDEETSDM